MIVENKINESISQLLENNNIKLASKSGGFKNTDFGGISYKLDLSIDISHIKNFRETLEILTDYDNSPIADDGYTGTDIHQPYGSSVVYYILEYGYMFDEHRDICVRTLKENCDKKMVDDILKKTDYLYSLGFNEISLSYSYFMEEQFEKRVKEEENQITAGYYNLEDEESINIKYKILGII